MNLEKGQAISAIIDDLIATLKKDQESAAKDAKAYGSGRGRVRAILIVRSAFAVYYSGVKDALGIAIEQVEKAHRKITNKIVS